MKNFLITVLLATFLCACASSRYAGQWQGQMNGKPCTMSLNSDGSVETRWFNKNGEELVKKGSWKQATEDSILLTNPGSEPTVIKLLKDQLIINRNHSSLIFHRKMYK